MKLVFLGTSSGKPSEKRNVSSVALVFPGKKSFWLFDCGDGTQRQLMLAGLNPLSISRVFLTHTHGDHVFGLPALLSTMSLQGRGSALPLHAPEGVEGFLRACQDLTGNEFRFPVEKYLAKEGARWDVKWEADDFTVRCRELNHGHPSYGFRIEEPARPGHLDIDKVRQAGLAPGPECGKLKTGQDVVLPDGRVVKASSVCAPPIPGRVVAIMGDSIPCASMVELARGADVMVCEATYGDADRERARPRGHSTAKLSAEAAAKAGVGRLILTHFSTRYEDGTREPLESLLVEARTVFPQTILAEDLLSVEISRREVPRDRPSPPPAQE